MKRRIYKRICRWIAAGCLVGLASCAGNVAEDISPEDKGEPISISFDMYTAHVTKAETATTEDMVEGKTFRIYAYNSVKSGNPDFSKPVASAVYRVEKQTVGGKDRLVAVGDLMLYRGAYYMYLVSYNDESETPVLDAGTGKITVENKHDFMYTTLENIIVQPENAGGNHMTVKLPTPFKRLGSRVIVKVAAKNIVQPVDISTLTVEDVKIGGLPASRTYELGEATWNSCNVYNSFYQYPKESFTRPDNSKFSFWSSTPVVLLPVDGSAELTFDVNLTVTYDSGSKSLTQVYPASIQKVLAPGMTYEFEFTLTFYGAIVATDLTLAVREYDTITLDNKDDGLGK
ncbi:hypothetical protein [uncultured Parabacteroides sp.]|uniref:hypothetical protein n=1 Tax=uncultured Parabacteroides sp. TaxID=512312 RepID=UPI0025990732|nr:hypothetical protein [uncultured Parabacteroides sp.]